MKKKIVKFEFSIYVDSCILDAIIRGSMSTCSCLVYPNESLQPAISNPARSSFCDSVSSLGLYFIVSRTRTKFGDQTFFVASPTCGTVCLSLLDQLRLASFKRDLKSHLFSILY